MNYSTDTDLLYSYDEKQSQKVLQQSLCTSSILFPQPLVNDIEAMRMRQQISQLSKIVLRLGRQKLEYKQTQEQNKIRQQQISSLEIENRQLKERNRQLLKQLSASRQESITWKTKNEDLSNQIHQLEGQLQILQKKLTREIQELPVKIQALSKICIKMAKQKLEQQDLLQCKYQQQLRQFEKREDNWKSELLVLQIQRNQAEKMLKHRTMMDERSFKDLQMKYWNKCKQMDMVNKELKECKDKYQHAVQQMNKKMEISHKQQLSHN